jgi:hypothetical protein
MVMEQLLVLVQQGFTFCRVDDDERDPGTEFDGCGKSTTPGANDAEFLKAVYR